MIKIIREDIPETFAHAESFLFSFFLLHVISFFFEVWASQVALVRIRLLMQDA